MKNLHKVLIQELAKTASEAWHFMDSLWGCCVKSKNIQVAFKIQRWANYH